MSRFNPHGHKADPELQQTSVRYAGDADPKGLPPGWHIITHTSDSLRHDVIERSGPFEANELYARLALLDGRPPGPVDPDRRDQIEQILDEGRIERLERAAAAYWQQARRERRTTGYRLQPHRLGGYTDPELAELRQALTELKAAAAPLLAATEGTPSSDAAPLQIRQPNNGRRPPEPLDAPSTSPRDSCQKHPDHSQANDTSADPDGTDGRPQRCAD